MGLIKVSLNYLFYKISLIRFLWIKYVKKKLFLIAVNSKLYTQSYKIEINNQILHSIQKTIFFSKCRWFLLKTNYFK